MVSKKRKTPKLVSSSNILVSSLQSLEDEVVTPGNLPFCDRWVDNCFTKRKTNPLDTLLENLNSYHHTSFEYKEGHSSQKSTKKTRNEKKKTGKEQVHWKSVIPERCKRNTILHVLHHAKQIFTSR